MQPDVIQVQVERLYERFPSQAAKLKQSARALDDAGDQLHYDDESDILRDMNTEIAKLEVASSYVQRDVTELRADVRDMRERLTRIEERISTLPGTGQLWGVGIAIVALIFAALALLPWFYSIVGWVPK